MTNKTETYAEHYAKLEAINKKLQSNQDNPTIIDELAPMLEQASKSYQICKTRIDAAEKFIKSFNQENNTQ